MGGQIDLVADLDFAVLYFSASMCIAGQKWRGLGVSNQNVGGRNGTFDSIQLKYGAI